MLVSHSACLCVHCWIALLNAIVTLWQLVLAVMITPFGRASHCTLYRKFMFIWSMIFTLFLLLFFFLFFFFLCNFLSHIPFSLIECSRQILTVSCIFWWLLHVMCYKEWVVQRFNGLSHVEDTSKGSQPQMPVFCFNLLFLLRYHIRDL